MNLPLPQMVNGAEYRDALKKAVRRIKRHKPQFLIVMLGLDPAKDDPTGTWRLLSSDFQENGAIIGRLKLPTLVIQEGGYRIRSLGVNARYFFTGIWTAMFSAY